MSAFEPFCISVIIWSMQNKFLIVSLFLFSLTPRLFSARILFDYTKNETAGNADWVVDHDYPYPLPSNPTSPTSWDGAISSWGYYLYQLGHEIVTLPSSYGISYGNPSNPLDLSNFHVFIMVEPQNPLTIEERDAILNFVRNGGGFFMVADHNSSDRDGDGWDSPRVLNNAFETSLGVHFNITGERPNSYNGVSSNVNTDSQAESIINGRFGRVTSIGFWSGTCITLNPSVNPNVFGLVWVNGASHDTDSIMAFFGYYGRGRFVGLGDSSPCDDGTGAPGDDLYDNWSMYSDSALILNATLWLIEGTTNVREEVRDKNIKFVKQSEVMEMLKRGVVFYNPVGQIVKPANRGFYFAKDVDGKIEVYFLY